MTDHPNLPLRDFLQGEQPVSTADLWGRICVARRWNPWEDLPATREELEHALAVLGSLGFAFTVLIERTDGKEPEWER